MNKNSIKYKLIIWNIISLILLFALILIIMQISVTSIIRFNIDEKLHVIANRELQMYIDMGGVRPPFPYKHKKYRRQVKYNRKYLLPPLIFNLDGTISKFADPEGKLKTLKPLDLSSFEKSKLGKEIYKSVLFTDEEIEQEPVRVLYLPYIENGNVKCIAQVIMPEAELKQFNSVFKSIMFAMIPIVVIFAILGGLLITKRLLKPIENLNKNIDKINETGIENILPIEGNDEFATLSNKINEMLNRIDIQFIALKKSIEREKTFTSDVSHELRTPLTVIKGNTSLTLKKERNTEYYIKTVTEIDKAADSMLEIVESLLLLSRAESGNAKLRLKSVNLYSLIEEIISNFVINTSKSIKIEDFDKNINIECDYSYIKQAMTNLLTNAIRYTDDSGKIKITADIEDKFVKISVSDNGCGIAENHIPHLTERFYRVDSSRNRGQGGTGLGLAITKTIVDLHNGKLEIKSKEGEGSIFSIYLPR